MTYFDSAKEVIKKINNSGYKAYIVGGAVRDHLLGLSLSDIDITTSALPSDIKLLFETKEKGKDFNAITILYNGYEFETTTFRKEIGYEDHRHPKYVYCDNINDDLIRRDFTINAMAMDEYENVIDLFDGRNDLDRMIIRAVDNPDIKFQEDALRMLRCCYFSAKLNFEIEEKTFEALKKNAYLVEGLSNDRISWELEKLANSNYPLVGLKNIVNTGVSSFLKLYGKAINTICDDNIEIYSFDDLMIVSAYYNQDKLNDYPLASNEKAIYKKAFANIDTSLNSDYTIFELGPDISNKVSYLRYVLFSEQNNVIERFNKLPIKTILDLEVRGKEIIDIIGVNYQRRISEIEKELAKMVLDNKIKNSKEDIVKYLLANYR